MSGGNGDPMENKARELALRAVARCIDAGWSEEEIQERHYHNRRKHDEYKDDPDGFGGYLLTVGPTYTDEEGETRAIDDVKDDQVAVLEVCGQQGRWIFDLHELYQEAKPAAGATQQDEPQT